MKIGISLGLGALRPVRGEPVVPLTPNALKTSDGFVLDWASTSMLGETYERGNLRYTDTNNG